MLQYRGYDTLRCRPICGYRKAHAGVVNVRVIPFPNDRLSPVEGDVRHRNSGGDVNTPLPGMRIMNTCIHTHPGRDKPAVTGTYSANNMK